MKKLYLAIGLLAICISLCIYEQIMITHTYNSITSHIDQTIDYLEKEDKQAVIKRCDELTQYWEKRYPFLSAMIDHQALDDASVTINALNDLAEQNSPNLRETLITAKNEIEVVRDNQRITIGNIF